ncbi:MAG TPA: TRAP transporter small permease subunit [Desulfobacterales bacterium]|nr:TRAP transporter small permease subunit [Desulfobacterales bacterium]
MLNLQMTMSDKKQQFRIDYLIVAILLFAMALIAFINVISRYFFHFSFAATEELTINMFVWMTVVGTGIAFERGGQMGMITLFNLFPIKFKKAIILFSAGLSAILFILVDYFMIKSIYDELTIFHATSGALGVPVWIYYSGVPILSIFVFRGIYNDAMSKLG